jgi:hypothetical protein
MRSLSSFFSSVIFAGLTFAANANAATAEPARQSGPTTSSAARVLVITDGSEKCQQELARLQSPGGEFDKLRAAGWKIGATRDNNLQIVDVKDVPEISAGIKQREFPFVAGMVGDEVVRYFRSGCTTPLDSWTFGWLLKGVNERPAGVVSEAARVETTNNYPLRGNHWSVDGDWQPSRETVVSHLRGPHGVQVPAQYNIETWSLEELRSLHDNLHDMYGGGIADNSRQQTRSSGFNVQGAASKMRGGM